MGSQETPSAAFLSRKQFELPAGGRDSPPDRKEVTRAPERLRSQLSAGCCCWHFLLLPRPSLSEAAYMALRSSHLCSFPFTDAEAEYFRLSRARVVHTAAHHNMFGQPGARARALNACARQVLWC